MIAEAPPGEARLRRYLVVAWLIWAGACAAAMVVLPAGETIPYHLGWAGFALTFGFANWHRWELVWALTAYTIATGAILVYRAVTEVIEWQEATEIPLMTLLAAMMVWHVLRRQAALRQARELAAREARASQDRELLMRLTSHELRTPITIAKGYLDLIEAKAVDHEDRQDAQVVAEELDRLSRVTERLVRVMGLQEHLVDDEVDVDALLRQVVERWRAVADRTWSVESSVGRTTGSAERMLTALDTLVENALRYTEPGDTIRVTGKRNDGRIVIAVADSGRGMTEEQVSAINAGTGQTADDGPFEDPLAGTGLGLGIVREIAQARGGTLAASHTPGGGATLTMAVPAAVRLQATRLLIPAPEEQGASLTPGAWAANPLAERSR